MATISTDEKSWPIEAENALFSHGLFMAMTAKKTPKLKPKAHKGDVPRGARTVAGIAGGAVFGFAVGGPAGAMFGGMAGLIIGASSDVGAYMDDW